MLVSSRELPAGKINLLATFLNGGSHGFEIGSVDRAGEVKQRSATAHRRVLIRHAVGVVEELELLRSWELLPPLQELHLQRLI
jgi:hypothetical protein